MTQTDNKTQNLELLDSVRYGLLCSVEILKVVSVCDKADHESAIAGLGAIAYQLEGLATELERFARNLAK